jgi:hypothetical protein
MKMARNAMLAMDKETKREIQQIKLDLKCKNEEDVILILLAHYNVNKDPIVVQAVNLINSIKKEIQRE